MKVKVIDNDGNPQVYLDGVRVKRNFKLESSRPIFLSKDYVIKLEEDSKYYLNQCCEEKRVWKSLKEEHRKYFVPTLKQGHQGRWGYVVQPKLKFKKVKVDNHPELDYLFDLLEKFGLNDFDDGNNIGITKDGRLLCYDYGV